MSLLRCILAAAVLAIPAAVEAGSRQQATVLLSDNPQARKFQEEWGYADAVVSGDMVYLSGVVAGVAPGETDLKLAYDRAFRQMGKILKRSGVGWDDVLDITSFHTDLTTQMPAIVAVKKTYMAGPPPAWTAIQVSRLIPDNGITEIKLVARKAKS
jgi:enamine deaminase RidA (YjgF/YER057c/UK114 family)